MKSFKAEIPNICSEAVRPLRTEDVDKLIEAIAALAPPFAPDVSAELVALAFAHKAANVRKKAMALVTKHVKDLPKLKAAYRSLAGVGGHVVDERLRTLEHPYLTDIAKALLFHKHDAVGIAFERDAAARAAILDVAVANAKREGETELKLGEVYWAWDGHGGWATSLHLRELPPSLFGELTKLRKKHAFDGLSFWGCALTDLPDEIVEAKSWLKSLSLAFNDFTELPDVLWKLDNLESLEILGLPIVEISDDIRKLTKLRSLDIGNMKKLKEIPESVCKLDKLEFLRIGNGSISKVPDAIGSMKSLREFEMQSAGVRKLPAIVYDMPNLKKINVRWTRIPDEDVAKLKMPGRSIET
jgi:hypothetical protein